MALSERMTKHIVQRSISEIIDVAASVPNVRLVIIKLGVVAQTVILALGESGQEDLDIKDRESELQGGILPTPPLVPQHIHSFQNQQGMVATAFNSSMREAGAGSVVLYELEASSV